MTRLKQLIVFLFAILSIFYNQECYGQSLLFVSEPSAGFIPFGKAAILTDPGEPLLVQTAARMLQNDIEKVTGSKPMQVSDPSSSATTLIVLATPASKWYRHFIANKILTAYPLENKWEAYQVKTVATPNQTIVFLLGSDRRGVAYAAADFSRQLGVSPWYWWADVPVARKSMLYIQSNYTFIDSPRVKYRGIFINDEAPALSGWAMEKFGGFNHRFYEKVFELMIRLKANYLWPAMWGHAFYDDDSLNIKTAEEYGIVIGTSHHEPLMRAHEEWRRYGSGKWNYDSNATRLRTFWTIGMQRATNEKIVSVGMRGDGDEPMSRETATTLLEKIVRDQRKIIEEVTHRPASTTPQLWALYKEVQDYYDKGMRVPDDVTLLLCDDNWGNIRRLPSLKDKPRKGGYGIYYHFDYVGSPRNYKWLNTNSIPRIWEQMHLAWEYKVRNIWIVNVGDIKPMELPVSFFLDYAWNPEKIIADQLPSYLEQWAREQFGQGFSKQIADILSRYGQYSSRIKPELLDPNTFDLNQTFEWNRVVNEWQALLDDAENIKSKLSSNAKDAYYQLVWHPIEAFSNLYNLYYYVALNRWACKNQYTSVKDYAQQARHYFEKDSLITLEYHRLANGKWSHLMDQTHIGYTNWQQPAFNKLPELCEIPPSTGVAEPHPSDTVTKVYVLNQPLNTPNNMLEQDGLISINADHFTSQQTTPAIKWQIIRNIGRTGHGVTPLPVTAAAQQPGNRSPHLAYTFYNYSQDSIRIQFYFSPTLNFLNKPGGMQIAVSIDDEKPVLLSVNKPDVNSPQWEKWVANNINITEINHRPLTPGRHILKYWMVDPGLVLQKIVLRFRNSSTTYLGPVETRYQFEPQE